MPNLSPRQYAKLKNIHFTTVYEWIKAGKIKTVIETKEFIRIPVDESEMSSTSD